MFYLIYGPQFDTIKRKQNDVVKEFLYEKDEFNFVRYDANVTPIQDIVEDCAYLPLGTDKKIVIIDNSYFFLKPKPKAPVEKEQMYDKFKEYLLHPSDETIAIFCVVSPTIDANNEYVKIILNTEGTKKIEVKDLNKDDFYSYAKDYFATKLKVSITQDALKELCARVGNDFACFKNNAHKLALYTNSITFNDVCKMVARPLEENTFQIFNYLLRHQNDLALSVYRDLEVANIEAISVISMLANQFRTLNQVYYLAKQGKSDEEIASTLGLNPVRVKILRGNLRNITSKKINSVLEDLYHLDSDIKNGLIDHSYSFELFLINFSTY